MIGTPQENKHHKLQKLWLVASKYHTPVYQAAETATVVVNEFNKRDWQVQTNPNRNIKVRIQKQIKVKVLY